MYFEVLGFVFILCIILLSYSLATVRRISSFSTGVATRTVLGPFCLFSVQHQRWLYTTDIVYTLTPSIFGDLHRENNSKLHTSVWKDSKIWRTRRIEEN